MISEISTTSKEERIKEYLATETLPALTTDEVKTIDETGSKVHHRAFVRRGSRLLIHSVLTSDHRRSSGMIRRPAYTW